MKEEYNNIEENFQLIILKKVAEMGMNFSDEDTLHINSTLTPDGKPRVIWKRSEREEMLTLVEARSQADLIFRACAIAESEAAIVRGFAAITKPSKGFGKREEDSLKWQVLSLIREHREPLGEGISVIFGYRTHMALVLIDWYGDRIQWDVESARHHAFGLLQCAESSESEAFYFYFLKEKVAIEDPRELNNMMAEYFEFRAKKRFESLMETQEC